jgi:hypothetical protein
LGVIFLVDAVVVVLVGAGGWVLQRVFGPGTAFYCEPLVPWRIEIAFTGSFGLAYFTFMALQRRRAWAVYPLALVGLLWIAPFYGFFSAPLFLAVSLNIRCPGRPIVTIVIVAVGIRVGERVALAVATSGAVICRRVENPRRSRQVQQRRCPPYWLAKTRSSLRSTDNHCRRNSSNRWRSGCDSSPTPPVFES